MMASARGSPAVWQNKDTKERSRQNAVMMWIPCVRWRHRNALAIREHSEPWYVRGVQRRVGRCETSVTTAGWVPGVLVTAMMGVWVTKMMEWWCAGGFSGVSWFYLLELPINCGPVVEKRTRYPAEDNPGKRVTSTDSLARASV